MYARSVVLVFLGACSYGVLSTFVKLAYADGYDTGHVTGSQMLFGTLMLWVLAWPFRRQWPRLTWREVMKIAAAGSLVGITGIFYYASLRYIPASIAIVLLFQFTWIGVLLEALTTRKAPPVMKGVSVAVLLVGTVLASGLLEGNLDRLPLLGLGLGFLSAVSYALFIYLSGRVAPTVSPWLR
ncbi:MAG TPA: DMT family transporter, partial [Calditerricola sp.]